MARPTICCYPRQFVKTATASISHNMGTLLELLEQLEPLQLLELLEPLGLLVLLEPLEQLKLLEPLELLVLASAC